MICKGCKFEVDKIFKGKMTNKNRKVYHDLSGRQWIGKLCPDCNGVRVKGSQRAQRLADVIDIKTPVRNCRRCKDTLPKSRYFMCEKCKPELTTIIDEDYMYVA